MKPISLHPVSVLVGCALAALAVLLAGAIQQPVVARRAPNDVCVVGQIPAEWWTFVFVSDIAGPYIVPADRHFVVVKYSGGGGLVVNGVNANTQISALAADVSNARVVFAPGTRLESTSIALWGYLEPV